MRQWSRKIVKSGIHSDQPAVAFATVGCRLNQAETEAVREEFSKRGWRVVEFSDNADLYFINTCTVTGRADRSSRQLIHRVRRKQPESVVVAAGCYAERAAEKLASEGEVDVILGVEEKNRPFEYLPAVKPSRPVVYVRCDPKPARVAVGTRVSGRSRAFLKVQDGCDHACAYCAVTLVRGPSRSVPPEEVREALRRILNAGFEEVVFTGVDISAWGRDLEYASGGFTTLVEMAAEEGIPRIRLSSLEPWELTPERIKNLAAIPQWCEHLHLSLQSADENLLKRMNRPIDMGCLRESLSELLNQRPQATVGADLIAGFPGEDEQAHEVTVSFLNREPLHYLHVFPYSIRLGTSAASMDGRLAPEIITRRAERLRREGRSRKIRHYADAVGNNAEILIETDGISGYTRNYLRVKLKGEPAIPRKRVSVRLIKLAENGDNLLAEEVR